MAWSNFLITAAGLGSVMYLMRGDVRHSATILRRNVKTMRSWIEEGAAEFKNIEKEVKQVEQSSKPPGSDKPTKSS